MNENSLDRNEKSAMVVFALLGALSSSGGMVAQARAARPQERTVWVSPHGSDSNRGDKAHPFATLEHARDVLRRVGMGQAKRVVLLGGTYRLSASFSLEASDSGTRSHPVVWEAAAGQRVRLVGAIDIPSTAFHPVKNEAILSRLDPAARGHVLEANLRALGITDLPAFPDAYHGAPPGPELFYRERRMTLARWPNKGWATISRIVEPGSRPRDGDIRGLTGVFDVSDDRPARWRTADGVWLQGYWCYDWYDEVIRAASIEKRDGGARIRLARPHVYGVMQGNPSPRRFRALNVLEELDEPGEFMIDRTAGRLYFWPPDSRVTIYRCLLSTLDAPIVRMTNASNVTLRGMRIECGLDNGIEVSGGERCRVEYCQVMNLRRQGIRVTGGMHHVVSGCEIHDTGQGGLTLAGGDRKTLTAAGHEAFNNHIWRFSEHQLTSAYGLSLEGVGNRAAHNLIEQAPHQAVFIGGNDHLFELNEVHHVCTETDDCGALYKGRNPSCRGNVIRYNYWHDIGSPMGHGNAAIYFDDGDGGDTVFGNLFVRCGDPGRGSFGTVFSHGGHGIRADNNIFVDCKRALGSAPWNDARWRAALKGAEETFFPEKLLKEVDITKPPYTTRYPELVGFMDPPPGAPRVSNARLNVMFRCGEMSGGNWVLESGANWSTQEDPGFVNWKNGDYRLRKDAALFQKLPGFEPLPFEKMGLEHSHPAPTSRPIH